MYRNHPLIYVFIVILTESAHIQFIYKVYLRCVYATHALGFTSNLRRSRIIKSVAQHARMSST